MNITKTVDVKLNGENALNSVFWRYHACRELTVLSRPVAGSEAATRRGKKREYEIQVYGSTVNVTPSECGVYQWCCEWDVADTAASLLGTSWWSLTNWDASSARRQWLVTPPRQTWLEAARLMSSSWMTRGWLRDRRWRHAHATINITPTSYSSDKPIKLARKMH